MLQKGPTGPWLTLPEPGLDPSKIVRHDPTEGLKSIIKSWTYHNDVCIYIYIIKNWIYLPFSTSNSMSEVAPPKGDSKIFVKLGMISCWRGFPGIGEHSSVHFLSSCPLLCSLLNVLILCPGLHLQYWSLSYSLSWQLLPPW